MKKTQYERERELWIKEGKCLKEFEKQWNDRAIEAYLEHTKNGGSENDFRAGKVTV